MAIVKGLIVQGNANVTGTIAEEGVLLENKYKQLQTPVTNPTASGSATSFIDTISQDAQGKITATKKNFDFSTVITQETGITVSTSGSGAVVTNVTASGHAVTQHLGALPTISTASSGSGNVVTSLSASGHTITANLGNLSDEKVKLLAPNLNDVTNYGVLLEGSTSGSTVTTNTKRQTVLYINESNGCILGPACTAVADPLNNYQSLECVVLGKTNTVDSYCAYTTSFGENNTINSNIEHSFVEGHHNIVNGSTQHVLGKYNAPDNTSALIIGNGVSTARSNAYTIDFNGNSVQVGSATMAGAIATNTAVRATNYYFAADGSILPIPEKAVNTTIANLISLKLSSQLVPGTFYRIIDYAPYLQAYGTDVAESHKFDIISLALTNSTLAEESWCCLPLTGTTAEINYWLYCDLSKWRVKYYLSTSGLYLLILWMKDDRNNEAPYDFKNVVNIRNFTMSVNNVHYDSELVNLPILPMYFDNPCFPDYMESYLSYHTFEDISGGDLSVKNNNRCYGNKILPFYYGNNNILKAPDICIISGSTIKNNTFGGPRLHVQIDGECIGNTITGMDTLFISNKALFESTVRAYRSTFINCNKINSPDGIISSIFEDSELVTVLGAINSFSTNGYTIVESVILPGTHKLLEENASQCWIGMDSNDKLNVAHFFAGYA